MGAMILIKTKSKGKSERIGIKRAVDVDFVYVVDDF